MRQILLVVPSIPDGAEITILSILCLKKRLRENLHFELIYKQFTCTHNQPDLSSVRVSVQAVSKTLLYLIHHCRKKNSMTRSHFSDPKYLLTTVFYISHILCLGHKSTLQFAYGLNVSYWLNIGLDR